jgi:hypothetical protein
MTGPRRTRQTEPEAVPSDRKEIVRTGYDVVSERYRADDEAPSEYEDWLRALTGHLPSHADVLDLGCGCECPWLGGSPTSGITYSG